jgi:hypothetical protein
MNAGILSGLKVITDKIIPQQGKKKWQMSKFKCQMKIKDIKYTYYPIMKLALINEGALYASPCISFILSIDLTFEFWHLTLPLCLAH